MIIDQMLSYDDVLLYPKHSTIYSRSEVDISIELCKGFGFSNPFIPANMLSIVGVELIKKVYSIGGLSILHRFMSIEDQLFTLTSLKKEFGDRLFDFVGVSVGIRNIDRDNIKLFADIGVKIVCVDIAHLDSTQGIGMIKWISTNYPSWLLIAGNVATGEGAASAWIAGADVCKVGIGGGGICSTRIETGCGVAQFSAIVDVAKIKPTIEKELNKKLYSISDGGIRNAGCCVKALCFSDMVMMGGYFAGCSEAPVEEIEINGQKLKPYHGSSTHKNSRIEGVKGVVHSKGSVLGLYKRLSEGVQSGCSYQNSRNLNELKLSPKFGQITNAGLMESKIHDVIML